jgi:hypothetical protein
MTIGNYDHPWFWESIKWESIKTFEIKKNVIILTFNSGSSIECLPTNNDEFEDLIECAKKYLKPEQVKVQ